MNIERIILNWCRELLEKDNGKDVKFDISELVKYLKSKNVEDFLIENVDVILQNLRKKGNLLYYYDKEKGGYILLRVIAD